MSETPETPTILDRWNYSGQPSVESFNHAVDVANALHRERLEQAASLTTLRAALEGMVDLTEAWIAGPLFEAAGIRWMSPNDHPSALQAARAALVADRTPRDDT